MLNSHKFNSFKFVVREEHGPLGGGGASVGTREESMGTRATAEARRGGGGGEGGSPAFGGSV